MLANATQLYYSGGRLRPPKALGPWLKTTVFQTPSLSVGGSVRRALIPPAFSWWSFNSLGRPSLLTETEDREANLKLKLLALLGELPEAAPEMNQ